MLVFDFICLYYISEFAPWATTLLSVELVVALFPILDRLIILEWLSCSPAFLSASSELLLCSGCSGWRACLAFDWLLMASGCVVMFSMPLGRLAASSEPLDEF